MGKPFAPMIMSDDFIEHRNIGWRIEQGKQDPNNPLMEPKYPWDSALACSGHGTVLIDPIDGLYKGWIVAHAEDVNYVRGQLAFRIVYITSADGVNWERPMLDVCPVPGYPKTNLIFDFEDGGRSSYASVFVDPEANPDEPYEMFVFRDPSFRCLTGTVAGFDQKPVSITSDAKRNYGLYRYRSQDGIHWRGIEGPLAFKSDDTLYVHKKLDGTYVSHHKKGVSAFPGGFVPYDVGVGECRITLRKTSKDGSNWSESVPIMMPDWKDHPGDQIMEVGHFIYGNGIIGLTAVYHATSQTMDLQIAASIDGVSWWRPSRATCLPLAPLGEYGGGMIWPTRTLVENADQWHLYYGALDGLHGDMYGVPNRENVREDNTLLFHGALQRCSWDVGRMWAAVQASGGTEMEGYLTTPPTSNEGKTLYINAVTVRNGRIWIELLNDEHNVIEGFSRDDFQPFVGDEKCAQMRWKGGEICPQDNVSTRFYIRDARLYGFEWR